MFDNLSEITRHYKVFLTNVRCDIVDVTWMISDWQTLTELKTKHEYRT
jgi:hypothetical protein